MKEASGELSMTAVAVVAIAAIGVVFTTLIFPTIKSSLQSRQHCADAYSCSCGDNAKTCDCTYLDGNTEKSIKCPNNTNTPVTTQSQ